MEVLQKLTVLSVFRSDKLFIALTHFQHVKLRNLASVNSRRSYRQLARHAWPEFPRMKWTFAFLFQNFRPLNGLLNISREIFPKKTKKILKILGNNWSFLKYFMLSHVPEHATLRTPPRVPVALLGIALRQGDFNSWNKFYLQYSQKGKPVQPIVPPCFRIRSE